MGRNDGVAVSRGAAVAPTDEGAPATPGPLDPALERAFDRLWRQYYRRLWAFARSYASVSSEEAEDFVQEIMWKVYRALPGLDRSRPSAPWVFRIARNHCIDRMRAAAPRLERGRELGAPEELADTSPGPSESLARSDARASVRRFMARLGPVDRQILYLAYYESLRMRDIGSIVDMPEGTVKYRIHELKRRLRRSLEEEA
jgi:RNA polymerase sigma-70 factor, ECF subfamily